MSFDVSILKSVLKITFETNMLFLKQEFPHLYERFVDYEPENYGLEMDPSGHLNLAGNGHFMYQGDPKETAQIQAERFFQNPSQSIYKVNPFGQDNPIGFKHLGFLTDIATQGEKALAEVNAKNEPYKSLGRFTFLSVIGIGLGYHLEHIAKQDIDHLYIYEPNNDLFYSSLFTLNWEWIVSQFKKDNKSITLLIGNTKERYMEGYQQLLFKFGAFKSGCIAIFNHYQSDTAKKVADYVIKNGRVLYSGFGFMEDEIMSLEHTYQNIHNKVNFLTQIKEEECKDNIPVFICGSGPSLDDSIEYIIEHKDKAIIVSCGSSIMALLKYGVVPDIHFEVERTKPTYDWLLGVDDVEVLKSVNFIGMNNIYPDVMGLFKNSFLFLKPNDAATALVKKAYGNYVELFATNPTVVNGAVAFLNQMKAGDTYLFGCDFGYKDPNKHHSTNTAYYGEFEGVYDKEFATDFVRKGNFCEQVYTTATFDNTRTAIEYSIRHHVNTDGDKKVYNCSDGVYVEGAIPLQPSEIELSTEVDAEHFYQQLLGLTLDELQPEPWEQAMTTELKNIIKFLDTAIIDERLLDIDLTPQQLISVFETVNHKLMSFETLDIIGLRLIRGSISYVQTSIIGYAYLIGDTPECRAFIKESIKTMFDYFIEMKQILVQKSEAVGVK